MATEPTPYVPRNPGDLITAGDWNEVQVDVKKDISAQIKTAVGQIKRADRADSAGNADTLGGKTTEQLTKEIIQKALEELPLRTGYRRTFNRLTVGKERVIKHGLGALPLVDVYQLDYFLVVCAKGETKADQKTQWVNFYLYNTSERRISRPETGVTPASVNIEPPDVQPFRILFSDMLDLYSVPSPDNTTLEDLETDFWKAFFGDPLNDEFDADQYCHSPWFEKCCGEQRSVADLKRRGDWDDIWFKMMPRKTAIYFIPLGEAEAGARPVVRPPGAPPAARGRETLTDVQVAHADFNTLVVKLLVPPVYPTSDPPLPDISTNELKVMLLLKV